MEVALEPLALDVACLDDSCPRRTQIVDPRPDLGLQALVVERETSRRSHVLDQLFVVQEPRCVAEHGQDAPLPNEARLLLFVIERHAAALPVDEETGSLEQVREDEIVVSDCSCENVSETAGWRRLGKVDDELGHRRPRSAAPSPAPRDAARDEEQRSGLAEPEPSLDRPVRELSAIQRQAEPERDQPEIDGSRDEHGTCRRGCPKEPPEREDGERERPSDTQVEAGPVEICERNPTIGDREQVLRTLRAAPRRRVEVESGQDAEHPHAPEVRSADRDTLGGRGQAPTGIGEHGVPDERRAGRVQAQTDRERERRSDAGVVPLRQEPGETGRREQRAEAARRPAQPEREPAPHERPPGREQSDACERRAAGEPVARIVARYTDREDARGNPERREPDGDCASTHV